MPYVERPDGASIYYEVRGSGFPLLLFAPGGINSQVSFWPRSAINPLTFADEFMVIGMDQRNAELSPGPLRAPTWDEHVADQLAVLDAVGVERTLIWGGCIGVAFAFRFVQEAPARVAAIVGQDPVGLVDGYNGRATFFAMFQPTIEVARNSGMQAVVDAALANPMFMANNAGGPFAARIAADAGFRAEVLALPPEEYCAIVEQYDANLWGAEIPYMSVREEIITGCPAPILILPGNDVFHPAGISERICREAPRAECLAADCRLPANVAATSDRVRAFLREHAT